MNGEEEWEIELPGIGTANGIGGKKEDHEFFYTFTSFNYPPTIFRYDIESGKSTLFRKQAARAQTTTKDPRADIVETMCCFDELTPNLQHPVQDHRAVPATSNQ